MTTIYPSRDGWYVNFAPTPGQFSFHFYLLPATDKTRPRAAMKATGCGHTPEGDLSNAVRYLIRPDGPEDSAVIYPPREWADKIGGIDVDGIADLLAHVEVCPLCATVYAAQRGLLSGLTPFKTSWMGEEGTVLFLQQKTAIVRTSLDFDTAHRFANRHGAKVSPGGEAPEDAEEYDTITTESLRGGRVEIEEVR